MSVAASVTLLLVVVMVCSTAVSRRAWVTDVKQGASHMKTARRLPVADIEADPLS